MSIETRKKRYNKIKKEGDLVDGAVRAAAKRLPWLISLLFLGLAVSGVSRFFEGVVGELPMLVAFQPLLLGMAGNAGTQSFAVTMRELAGDEKSRTRMILSEVRIAFLAGLVIGAISFFAIWAYLGLILGYPTDFAASAAFCIGASSAISMTVSGVTGSAIPIVLCRFGADPAVASGPLITTVSDLCALVCYYSIAWAMILK